MIVWFVRWNNGMHAKFNSQQYATKGTIRRSAGTEALRQFVPNSARLGSREPLASVAPIDHSFGAGQASVVPIATGAFTEKFLGADTQPPIRQPPIRMALFMFARVEKKSVNPVDKHVGRRVRMRRMMLAMIQEKLGNALGLR
jgi:hypothetical protein